MIVHLKASISDGDPTTIFLDLVKLDGQSSSDSVLTLEGYLRSVGFTEQYLMDN